MAQDNPATPRQSVLIVDDDQAFRDTMVEILQSEGYEVLEAADGNQAYALLEKRAASNVFPVVDVVVSDWKMPGADGLTLLRKIRQSPFHKLPFLLVSGAVSREQLETAVREGADVVLLKPFQAKDFMMKLDEALVLRSMKQLRKTR